MDVFQKLKSRRPLTSLGIMTGTSMDGVDICMIDIDLLGDSARFEVKAFKTFSFPLELRKTIQFSLTGSTEQVCRTHYDLGRFFAEKTIQFMSELTSQEIDVIGMHGQTVYHINGEATLQIGEPSFLAEQLGVPVVSDFRARDISVGGTGAPLIPIVDKWIFQREKESIICLNLGGIANVSFIPPKVSKNPIFGFDTGPGMSLLDEAISILAGKEYDESGKYALAGIPDEETVQKWMNDEFVTRTPPKSTGRDYFGASWLKSYEGNLNKWNLENLLATLSLFTARSVAVNCRQFIDNTDVASIIVSGGGVHHMVVMNMLSQEFSPIKVVSSKDYGIDPDIKEALGMAMLAVAYFKEIPGNIPSVTGALQPVILGKLTL